jgi:hypothetical protein
MCAKTKREAIISALHKIEEYCKNEIMPKMKYKNDLSVEFGEWERYNGWDASYKHSFSINKRDNRISYRTGGLWLRFKTEKWDKDRLIYDNWTYAKDLILHWQEVKAKIFDELIRQEAENSAIMDFEV